MEKGEQWPYVGDGCKRAGHGSCVRISWASKWRSKYGLNGDLNRNLNWDLNMV